MDAFKPHKSIKSIIYRSKHFSELDVNVNWINNELLLLGLTSHTVKPGALKKKKNPNVVDLLPKLWAITTVFNLDTLNLVTTPTPVVIKRDLNLSQQHLMFLSHSCQHLSEDLPDQGRNTNPLNSLTALPLSYTSHRTIRTFMSSFLAISFSTLLWVQPKFQAGSWCVCSAWHSHQHHHAPVSDPGEESSPNSNNRGSSYTFTAPANINTSCP